MSEPPTTCPAMLSKIEHFVVLMLENRSFDHLLGPLMAQNPAIVGALDNEFTNPIDPAAPASPTVSVGPVSAYAMPFDPGHEFIDVQIQLYGRAQTAAREPAPRVDPAPMSGFVYSAELAAQSPARAAWVMQTFPPGKLSVITALATEFAVFNYWHSSLPGPTWPNRFFAHAATSGGLSDSPKDADILAGYTFPAGTIYQRLDQAHKTWRIYHDGLPHTAGIDSLRSEFLNVLTKNFRDMDRFESDLRSGDLPHFVFIEPRYDTGHEFVGGNSMHPKNDARKGEALIKSVYEAIRSSRFWGETMFVVAFDEHGGFFDHVSPPAAIPPGGDARYANPVDQFNFDRLGVRVPAIVVSAYTDKGTVIGDSPLDYYDHTSILATVEKRFGLPPITNRDKAAWDRTLETALNLTSPRLSPDAAPMSLPAPLGDGLMTRFLGMFVGAATDPTAPLSQSQRVQLALAHACNLQVLDPSERDAAHQRYLGVRGQADAADYIKSVEDRIRTRRQLANVST